jgi:TrmH family RNA methyltransferase
VAARNPLNIGAAARAMTNFGFGRLGVVNAYNIGFREARSAVGAADLLRNAVEYASVAEAVADSTLVVGTTAVRHRDVQHPVRQLENGGRLIRKRLATGRVALLFGSEKFGLSNKDLSHCDWLMRIPTHEQNISMNLGQSVAVCLYELVRDAKSARSPEKLKLASAGELERITLTLLDVMRDSGYLRRRPIADVEERMRRLIHRMNLPASDTVVWLGILRQIAWKMKTASSAKK